MDIESEQYIVQNGEGYFIQVLVKPEQAPALGMDIASSATCIPPASRPALFSDLSRPSWQLGVNGIRCIHVMTQSKIELYILKIV